MGADIFALEQSKAGGFFSFLEIIRVHLSVKYSNPMKSINLKSSHPGGGEGGG